MPEARDLPGSKHRVYATWLPYPRTKEKLPRCEIAVETRETEEPFRIGFGWALRIPFTRVAVVVGRWQKESEEFDEDERLTEALRGRAIPLWDPREVN